MRYTRFTINGYKGIPKIELDLSKKPSSNIFTLVGLNESGKTSILEAIYLFRNKVRREDAHALIPKSYQYAFNGTISVEAELEFDNDEIKDIEDYLQESHGFYLEYISKTIKIKKEIRFERSVPVDGEDWENNIWTLDVKGKAKKAKRVRDLYEWNQDVWQDVVDLIEEEYLPRILYYQDFLFKFPEKIFLKQFQNEGAEQKEYRAVIQDILDSIEKKLKIKEDLLERMQNKDERPQKQALEQLLSKMSSKLNEKILKKWNAIFAGAQSKEVNISSDSEIDVETGNKRHFIELKIKQGDDIYSIDDRSLGFRWFFSFLIFTAFRKSRSSDPGETLFLLDEPASNLHQRSQQKLLQSLENIVSDCKLIYSTHSHHLINPKWLAGTYIVRNKAINYKNPEETATTETDINAIPYKNFVAQHPDEEHHFKPILDALEYTPSRLEIVPPIVFTEGKNDYYILKYVLNVLFKEKNSLNFYPGAGVNKYEDPFRLYLAWNKNFIALFDSDGAGEKAKSKYIKEISPDVKDRIFTLQDVDKKWKDLKIEGLFSEHERIRLIQECFPDHKKEDGDSKSKFNTAIEELYINDRKFGFNKTTLRNFRKIFDFLEDKLDSLEGLH